LQSARGAHADLNRPSGLRAPHIWLHDLQLYRRSRFGSGPPESWCGWLAGRNIDRSKTQSRIGDADAFASVDNRQHTAWQRWRPPKCPFVQYPSFRFAVVGRRLLFAQRETLKSDRVVAPPTSNGFGHAFPYRLGRGLQKALRKRPAKEPRQPIQLRLGEHPLNQPQRRRMNVWLISPPRKSS